MKTTILETTQESGTKNASEESESEDKAKGKAATKEESKCETEEAQYTAKETFEDESCKTETNGTKARQEVRRLEAEPRLVCVRFLMKISHSKSIFFLRKYFYKHSSRKFKIRVGGKVLKYGGNKKNHIFTIDNTNALKKKRSQLARLKPMTKSKYITCTMRFYDPNYINMFPI